MCLEKLPIFISTISGSFIALFTFLLWKISKVQHKFNYEQELQVHPHWHSTPPEAKVYYTVLIVNPNRTPVVIENITEQEDNRPIQPMCIVFDIPSVRPERTYISTFPWIIPGQSFGIWSRVYSITKESGKIDIAVVFHDYRKEKLNYKRTEVSYKCPSLETKGITRSL